MDMLIFDLLVISILIFDVFYCRRTNEKTKQLSSDIRKLGFRLYLMDQDYDKMDTVINKIQEDLKALETRVKES